MAPETVARAVPLPADTGLPQGNPVSTILFWLVLHNVISKTRVDVPHPFRIWAYADDIAITAAPEHMDAVLKAFQANLQSVGLEINIAKTAVWIPDGTPLPEDAILAQAYVAQQRKDSITVCGLPANDVDASSLAVPIGMEAYIADFLQRRGNVLVPHLTKLTTMSHEPFVTNTLRLWVSTALPGASRAGPWPSLTSTCTEACIQTCRAS
eukprot:2991452-Amphidinium_carterae.1